MALAEAILVCLSERPMTGYELAKTFDSSIGFFWKANHQQIYRELARLKETGMITSEDVPQLGKPNRILYTVSSLGLGRLAAWCTKATSTPALKDDLLVKLYALEKLPLDAIAEDIRCRLENHRHRRSLYEHILHRRYEHPELTLGESGRLLGLNFGLEYERTWIEWCENTLEALGRLQSLSTTSKQD